MSVFAVSVLSALVISCFCSLMESVLLSLSQSQITEISEKHPKAGALWNDFKSNIDRPISAILILNTTAHTIGATIAGNALASLTGTTGHQKAILWGFSFIFTFLMLQYTEILPKTIGVHHNKFLAVRLVRPLSLVICLATPISIVTHWLNKPFESSKKEDEKPTIEDLRYMVTWARMKKLIGERQEGIIMATAALSEKKASDVMIPINDVVFLSNDLTIEEAIDIAHVDAHTRFPVCEGNHRNKIVGYVNFKEIISHKKMNPKSNSIKQNIRPIPFVDAKAPASDLLPLFTMKHEHLAMIRNEKGNSIGMVTLEDLIEELIGEREDEFDRLPLHIHHLPDKHLLLGGGCKMGKVRQLITHDILLTPINRDHDFASDKDDQKTLDSWLEDRLGRTPIRGDQITINGIRFYVRRVRRGRVFDALICKSKDFDSAQDDVKELPSDTDQ